LVALAFFALEPFNFTVPFLGMVDDLVVLPLLLRALAKFVSIQLRPISGQPGPIGARARDDRVVSIQ
jgi:uncharacterized membrane protein YkvA (DUF1232 family)